MWRLDPEPHWREVAQEVLTGMKGWREAHPRATWIEIEAAVDERLALLRGHMLEDAAVASPAADSRGVRADDRPRYRDCGAALVAVGQERRRLTASHDRPITLERTAGRCPACGTALFPPRRGVGTAARGANADPARGAGAPRRLPAMRPSGQAAGRLHHDDDRGGDGASADRAGGGRRRRGADRRDGRRAASSVGSAPRSGHPAPERGRGDGAAAARHLGRGHDAGDRDGGARASCAWGWTPPSPPGWSNR